MTGPDMPAGEPTKSDPDRKQQAGDPWEIQATASLPAPPLPADPSVPQIPGYTILSVLGRGGMGVVYKAWQQSLNRHVALKVILKERLTHPDAVRRFRREAQAAARLSHPHIVKIYDADQTGDTHYIAMEYVEGVNLHRLVEQSGRLSVVLACDYVRQSALGLQHALECGLVHRDIKPSNLIVTFSRDPEGSVGASSSGARLNGVIKILDMGLARMEQMGDEDDSSSTLTQDGVVLGTLDYIAPEQAQDPHAADIRSDLYSLGCSFYYLLIGRVPFTGGTPLEKLDKHRWIVPRPVERLRGEIPKGVAAVVRKLLAKNPEERYQTPAELAVALEPFCVPGSAQSPAATSSDSADLTSAADMTRAEQPAAQEATQALPAAAVEPVGECRRLEGHTEWVWCVSMASDGRSILSGSGDQTLGIWDVASGREAVRLHGHQGAVKSAAFSADGRYILSGSADRTMRLWDVATGRELRPLLGHKDVVKCVAFSPDGCLALSGSGDKTVRLWDLDKGRKDRCFKGHTGDVNSVAFVPGGRFALSGSWDKTLRLWDLATGRELQRQGGAFTDYQWSVVMSVAFRADGRLLTGSSDHTLRLWEPLGAKELRRFEGHTNWVASVAFSPDGRLALSGSWDHTVRLWDVETGRELNRFLGHTDQVHSVAFAPDGVHAVSGSADKTIRWWRVLP